MAGYQAVLNLRKLEERVDCLGFRMGNPKHGNSLREFGDLVALFPKEDALPIYSRDAEIYVGTLEAMEYWLNGFEKSRQYDSMLLGPTHDKKRERKEQDYRNRELLKKIKEAGDEHEEVMEA
jgi:hypothetical protein